MRPVVWPSLAAVASFGNEIKLESISIDDAGFVLKMLKVGYSSESFREEIMQSLIIRCVFSTAEIMLKVGYSSSSSFRGKKRHSLII